MAVDDAIATITAGLDPLMLVVTAAAGGERAGCLVGFHAQCSIEPFRYTVWLSKANRTYEVGRRAEHLAVHFLARSQRDLAAHFGSRTGDDVDKFAGVAWHPGPGDVPVLDECSHWFVGRRTALLDEGSDHVAVVLEPTLARAEGELVSLRLADVDDLEPGHEADEAPHA